MRQSLLSIAAVGFIVLFSSNVVAGGEGCASKKGHKDMSADAIQKFKKDHSWAIEEGAHADKSEPNKDAAEDKAPEKSDSDLIGA